MPQCVSITPITDFYEKRPLPLAFPSAFVEENIVLHGSMEIRPNSEDIYTGHLAYKRFDPVIISVSVPL